MKLKDILTFKWLFYLERSRIFRKEVFNTHAKAIAIEEMPSKVIVLNNKFQVVFWNNRDERSFGYSEKEMLGKIPDFLFPNGHRLVFIGLVNQWREDMSLNERNVEMEVITKKQTKFPVDAIFVSRNILQEEYLFIVLKDATESRKIKQKYEHEIELYKYGERIGKFGSWYWDIVEDKLYVSDGFKKLFQINSDVETGEYFMKRIHPDDRPMVKECIMNGFNKAMDYAIPSYRIVGENLQWRKITCIAEAKKNEDGKLIAFLGFIKYLDE